MKDEDLISAWIALAKADKNSNEYDKNFWAQSEMWELNYDNPEKAWDFILRILKKDHSRPVVEQLSAGPLENLLAEYGDKFIERVETEASNNPDFGLLLTGVWQNTMSDEVWERVLAAREVKDGVTDA